MKTTNIISTALMKQHPLLLLAMFSISLLLIRAKLTQSVFFFFLIWNLFLAWLPLRLSSFIVSGKSLITKNLYFYPLVLTWLLLLPNAPYIITDFIHLKKELQVPVWFDVLLLISFSATGMLFGLASMKDMFRIINRKFSIRAAWFGMLLVCLLSGFGIYIGRYLRYNSWDILHRPFTIVRDICTTLSDPFELRAATGITLGFGVLMFLLFQFYHTPEKNL
jgi:uncharacterized membrane protein